MNSHTGQPWQPAAARRWIALAALCAALLLSSTPALAATPATHVTPDLKTTGIHIQTLREGVLTYFDANRHLQVQPLTSFVQLRFAGPQREPDARLGMIELIDGQLLIGELIGADEAGERLHWQHPQFGAVVISLEQVAAVSLHGPLPPRRRAVGTDQVVMANGDQVHGFLEAVGPETIRLKPAAAPSMTLPLANVLRIDLANPPRYVGERHLVGLDDLSRLRAGDLTIINGRVSLIDTALNFAAHVEFNAARLRRVDLAHPGRQLIDLASLPAHVEAGGEVFGLPTPPVTVGSALRLHAPITVRFDLPDAAARFAAVLQLDDEGVATSDALAWADFVVIFRDDAGVLVEAPISYSNRSTTVNLELTRPTLWIELDPAANGPIMDRLRIRDAMILITSDAGPAGR